MFSGDQSKPPTGVHTSNGTSTSLWACICVMCHVSEIYNKVTSLFVNLRCCLFLEMGWVRRVMNSVMKIAPSVGAL